MFDRFQEKVTPLDVAIVELVAEMKTMEADSEQYNDCMRQLERLYKLKAENRRKRVSPDTLAIVIGNIVVVLIIVKFERGAVMVTKAKDYLQRTHN